MLKLYNKELTNIGGKLRSKILFDIEIPINNFDFFKIKFFKNKQLNNLVLKFI